jgi:dTDP-4-amino-4,6-dideoxygalactose transaminase
MPAPSRCAFTTPCHLLAPYRHFEHAPLAVAERAAGEILSLPMFPYADESSYVA